MYGNPRFLNPEHGNYIVEDFRVDVSGDETVRGSDPKQNHILIINFGTKESRRSN